MNLEESGYSVLVLSASDSFNTALCQLLPDTKFSPIRLEAGINAGKRALSEQSYDLIIINSPLPDDAGIRFAMDRSDLTPSVVLLVVRAELYAATYAKAVKHGVYLLPKPTAKAVVAQALDWMVATRERLKAMERKTISTEEKMQEIRIVNRAKWCLIEKQGMTEAEAHRLIEKQAMDRCLTKREIAEEILAHCS